jgi:hypothetical protein
MTGFVESGNGPKIVPAGIYSGAERRIELFSIGTGMLATAAIAAFAGLAAGGTFLLGAAISWLNFRWLKQGVSAFVGLAVAEQGSVGERERGRKGEEKGPAKVKVPASVYVKFGARYLLLLAVAYVILSRLRLPAAYLIAGLFVVVAAVLLELVLEIFGLAPSAEIAKSLRQD